MPVDDRTGQWGTLSLTIPDFLADVRDAINDFAELLISVLEIANQVLEFVKAFIRGYIDPMVILIEAIIDEITAILTDLREIGLYITGDWALLGWPPEDLRGGFSEYERRMIARLSDRTDPTRPDFSSKVKVLGFFGYLSVDPSEFERLINFVTTIIKMFGLSFFPDTSGLPVPTIQDTLYGPDTVAVGTAFQFGALKQALTTSDGTPPARCRVTWIAQPASAKHPMNPFPVTGPSGYIVTVSTLPDGIALKYARPKANTDKKAAGGDPDKLAQPRESGSVLDLNGTPLVLHGGAEMLAFEDSGFGYNEHMDDGIPEDGSCQVFGLLDPSSNEIIPLELLGNADALGTPLDGKGEDFYLQRTFLVGAGVALAQWFSGEYGAVFHIDDMPRAARFEKQSDGTFDLVDDGPAVNYYVRVWATGKEVAEATRVPQWDFEAQQAKNNATTSGQPFVVGLKCGPSGIGMPSGPRKITFVNANTNEYLHALETALMVLVLSRSDLPLLDELVGSKPEATAQGYRDGKWAGQGFALTATGLEDSRHLVSLMYPNTKALEKPNQPLQAWRTVLFQKVRQMAQDIYEQTGPMPDVEKIIVDATTELRTVTWDALLDADDSAGTSGRLYVANVEAVGGESPAMFKALDPANPVAGMSEFGVAPNVMSMGVAAQDVETLFFDPAYGGRGPLRHRASDFVLWDGGSIEIVYEESDPGNVRALKASSPASLVRIYDKFTDKDGKLLIPEDWRQYFQAVEAQAKVVGSADKSPVFVSGASQLVKYTKNGVMVADWPGALFLRGIFRLYENGLIYQQAAIALRVATAASSRAPEDGEWIAMRLFDAFPELETFLNAVENWVKSLASAAQSMADAIIKYIEFVQAQIVELQQLIARINGLIQSFMAFSFSLPEFSGLMLLSDGTDGVLSDLVTAKNKPSDSPLSYAAGLALVIPFGPSFIFDLIALAGGEDNEGSTPNPDPNVTMTMIGAPDPIGIEQIPPGAGPAPTDEPDVL